MNDVSANVGLTHSSLLELMRALEQKPITEVYAMIGLGPALAAGFYVQIVVL